MKAAALLSTVILCAFAARERAAGNDPRIARIREWYSATEKALPTYHVVRRDLIDFSSQGGVLTAYLAGDTLAKLDAVFLEERGRATETYYLHADSVYFVSRIVGKYDLSMDGRLIHRVQYRMYFDRDTLIRWIDTTGKDLSLKTRAAEEETRQDLTQVRILVACAKLEGSAQSCEKPASDST
jgi:hypothetical protein